MGSDSAAPTKIGRARKKVEIKVKLSPTGPSIVFSSFEHGSRFVVPLVSCGRSHNYEFNNTLIQIRNTFYWPWHLFVIFHFLGTMRWGIHILWNNFQSVVLGKNGCSLIMNHQL